MRGLSVVIGGSYRKFWGNVLATIQEFNTLGAVVLAPPAAQSIDTNTEFVLFEGHNSTEIGVIERGFLEAILQADLFYLVNPGGYIGLNLAFEIGFAGAAHTSKKWGGVIAAGQLPQDEHTMVQLSLFDVFFGTPQETVHMIQSGRTVWY